MVIAPIERRVQLNEKLSRIESNSHWSAPVWSLFIGTPSRLATNSPKKYLSKLTNFSVETLRMANNNMEIRDVSQLKSSADTIEYWMRNKQFPELFDDRNIEARLPIITFMTNARARTGPISTVKNIYYMSSSHVHVIHKKKIIKNSIKDVGRAIFDGMAAINIDWAWLSALAKFRSFIQKYWFCSERIFRCRWCSRWNRYWSIMNQYAIETTKPHGISTCLNDASHVLTCDFSLFSIDYVHTSISLALAAVRSFSSCYWHLAAMGSFRQTIQ